MSRWLLVLILVGCKGRTELMIGIATDLRAPDALDEAQLTVSRTDGGDLPQQLQWQLSGTPNEPFNLPGSYGVFSDGDEFQITVELQGFKNGSPLVTRTAVMSLVEGQTLFYRMTLVSGCMNKNDCGPNESCIEGACAPRELDSRLFPAFNENLVTELTCASGVDYIDTATNDPMPLSPTATECPGNLCSEGTCLVPPDGDGPSGGDGGIDPGSDGGGDGGLISPNPGFVPPTAPLAANMEISQDNWTEVGPADLSCLGMANTDPATTVSVTLSTSVRDFQSDNIVAGATVSLFEGEDPSSTFASSTTNGSGNVTLTVPSGTGRFGFELTAPDFLRTLVLRSLLSPAQANQSLPPRLIFSNATSSTLPALIGVSRTPGTGLVVATFRDCQGREVSNFIATVSSTPGVPAHVAGADTYYFSSSTGLPVRHSQRLAASEDGQFMVIELPPNASAFLQIWGFRNGTDLANNQLTLVGELAVPILPDTVISGVIDPLRQ